MINILKTLVLKTSFYYDQIKYSTMVADSFQHVRFETFIRIPGPSADKCSKSQICDLSKVANIEGARMYLLPQNIKKCTPGYQFNQAQSIENAPKLKRPFDDEPKPANTPENSISEPEKKTKKRKTCLEQLVEMKKECKSLKVANEELTQKLTMFAHLFRNRNLLDQVITALDSTPNN